MTGLLQRRFFKRARKSDALIGGRKMAGSKKVDEKDSSIRKLRAEAEKIIRGKAPAIPENLESLTPAEARKLLHELRVHQVELELQNEELRNSQEKLEASRAQYFDLYDLAPVGYFSVSEKGLILQANLAGVHLLGVMPDALRARRFAGFIRKDDQDVYYLRRKQLFESLAPQSCEVGIVRRDGSPLWVRLDMSLAQDSKSGDHVCLVVMSDITLRKHAEDALREKDDEFRASMENAPDGIFIFDLESNLLYANRRCEEITGYRREELTGKNWLKFNVLPRDRLDRAARLLQANIQGKSTGPDEFMLVGKGGNSVPVEINTSILRQEGKSVVMVFVRDITRRKQMADELQMMAAVVHHSGELINLSTPDGQMVFLNPAGAAMLGIDPEEVKRFNIMQVIPDHLEQMVESELLPALLKGGTWEGDLQYQNLKTGVLTDVHVMTFTVKDPSSGEPLYLANISLDITARKRVEKVVRLAESRVRMNLDSVLSHVGDIGKLELADIVDIRSLQLMMNDFFKLTKIGIAIIDMKGSILVATGWQDICTQFHRVHPETCKNCIESDRQLSEGLKPGAFKIYKCKNSMWDIATPIMVGEKHVGNLFLGQFLFDDEVPDREFFRAQARQYGFNEDDYLAALDRVPRWSRETVDTVMAFYARFAQMISMALHPFLSNPPP
jgi:PAS domain S-box-containing protein